ncbi:DNA base-flipping protein [Cyberlindnera fabianii]|uniref:6-O-methylguanine-DNA methyltransferase n=1 Tax=Cyberlindnera fabianii TaxID=36022 RepID=A0A1V2L4P3_CYBFA|nr:DNA base-flipping protein [Cyberlindnera fabianii]
MSRNDEARAFHFAVYETVQQIPEGRVTTYGHIAKLVLRPRNSRQVGQALKLLPNGDSSEYPFSIVNVPWWRVISSAGVISPRRPQDMRRQKEMLEREGVNVLENNKIRLSSYGWFPDTEFDDNDSDSN